MGRASAKDFKPIPSVITIAVSFLLGYIAAVWVTYLDPTGTGGGILAIPAILAVGAYSVAAFVAGVAALVARGSVYILFSTALVPIFFFASSVLVRL